MKIKNLLFDFGGVLYNIDYHKSIEELAKLSDNPHRINSLNLNEFMDVPELFECGKISPDEFRKYLRNYYNVNGTDEDIDKAWNSMLLGIKAESVSFIRNLMKTYNVSLFSNTNKIHYNYFKQDCNELLNTFNHYYLSFEIGYRKPVTISYRNVCDDLGWKYEETLFIDDSERNVEGAIDAGLQGLFFLSDMTLSDILHTI